MVQPAAARNRECSGWAILIGIFILIGCGHADNWHVRENANGGRGAVGINRIIGIRGHAERDRFCPHHVGVKRGRDVRFDVVCSRRNDNRTAQSGRVVHPIGCRAADGVIGCDCGRIGP